MARAANRSALGMANNGSSRDWLDVRTSMNGIAGDIKVSDFTRWGRVAAT